MESHRSADGGKERDCWAPPASEPPCLGDELLSLPYRLRTSSSTGRRAGNSAVPLVVGSPSFQTTVQQADTQAASEDARHGAC